MRKSYYAIGILSIICIIFIIFIIFICFNQLRLKQTDQPRVQDGFLDLTEWDFDTDGNTKLDGTWEFYWDQLISPGEFNNPQVTLTGYYPTPDYWTKFSGLKLPSKGYATYRIVIRMDKIYKSLSIKTPELYTEYILWINGKFIDGHGSILLREKRYLKPDTYTFSNDSTQIEIVLQIKNSSHINAGIGQSFLIGTPNNIYNDRLFGVAIDIAIMTTCILFGLYHLILFWFRRQERSLLYFAIISILAGMRTILSNETYLVKLIPNLSFELGSKIITSNIPLFTAFILLYVYELYKGRTKKIYLAIQMLPNIIYFVLTLTTTTYFYSSLFGVYLISLIIVCFLIIISVVKGIIEGDMESWLFFAGSIGVVVSAFNDMLYYNQMIDTGYYLTGGLVFFFFLQSIIFARRFSNLVSEKEELYHKLSETDLAFMQAQIKPHFIYNALNSISYLTTTNPNKAKEMILDFSDYLRGSFVFDNENGMTTLDKELELLRAYLSIEQERFGERLKTNIQVDEDTRVSMPSLCIQPIVENAVKHGLMDKIKGGTVTILIDRIEHQTRIVVEDDGIGMEEDKMNDIMNDKKQGGVGIKNIHNRLKLKYGFGLTIHSKVNEGTRVEIRIPQDITGRRDGV